MLGSRVVPDFEDTKKNVVGQVHEVLHGLDLLRVGRVQHVQPRKASLGREGRRQHVGTQARPAHAEHHGVGEPRAPTVRDEVGRMRPAREVWSEATSSQPNQASSPDPGPHRGVAGPDPCHHVVVAPIPDRRIDLVAEVSRKRSAHGHARG